MSVFKNDYAGFYDSLYTDKNYKRECDFVEEVFKKNGLKAKNILDLGCGTGSHCVILSERGYNLTGVDRSSGMLEIAKEKAKKSNLKIKFYEGDIRKINLKKKFDAVICMFAVMGYQASNSAVEDVCKTARKHLKNGGVFIFDCWFGPAVLCDRPASKIKEVNAGDGGKIVRITEPEIDIIGQTVNVNFKVKKMKGGKIISETNESHLMRFFFPQEIEFFLKSAGFKKTEIRPFLRLQDSLTEKDWNISVIGR